MILLVDHQIQAANKQKRFGTNFDESGVQPASYDLRIGRYLWSPASEMPEKPIDLELNGGAHRIPPYGVVIVQTHETFTMPDNYVGRLGLKSGLARRAIIASLGPQVDPGFRGKLFVTLMNQKPLSHVVKYKDTFLTVEFTELDDKPKKPYQGPYQDLDDSIGPEILEDLVHMEGLNLSQIQHQFTELREHVEKWSNLATRFDEFLQEMTLERKAMNRQTAAIQELVLGFSERITSDGAEEVEIRKISHEQAVKEILQLFQKQQQKNVYYSDIVEALCLDLATVMAACKELEDKGLIVGGSKK
ncbi:MAG: hypothetical protein IH983_01715 [Planctomycetes bacterium]|nr:hypothetical protein [Planctomycetota bacterium]